MRLSVSNRYLTCELRNLARPRVQHVSKVNVVEVPVFMVCAALYAGMTLIARAVASVVFGAERPSDAVKSANPRMTVKTVYFAPFSMHLAVCAWQGELLLPVQYVK
jgi:hypothetical protein